MRSDAGLTATPEDGRDYVDVDVPEGLAERTRALFGLEAAPGTLGEILHGEGEMSAIVPEDASWRDLLLSEDSRHTVRVGDKTHHTYCVLDALVLAFLLDETVEISSVPPGGGSSVEIVAGPDRLEASPASAVVSFGFSLEVPKERASLDAGDPEALQELVHAEGCPRINAFPDREAYEAWAGEVEAVTVGISLVQAYAMARDASTVLDA